MTLVYRIRGYSKQNSALYFEEDLPAALVAGLQRTINDHEDPELIWPHALDREQVHKVATALDRSLDSEALDYFVECSADWGTIKATKRRMRALA